MKLLTAILLLLLSPAIMTAQHEENIWVFGDGLGLDFNTGTPTVIQSNTRGSGGTASVCNPDGELLFYTNGLWVWNRHHEIMPELTGGIPGYTSPYAPYIGFPPLVPPFGSNTYQNAVITNVPNQPDQYYIFSTGNNILCYSVIDMTLNGGLGGILPGRKSIPLITGHDVSNYLTAVKGCNCIWLITHAGDANRFYAFEINDTGIVTTPVISDAGTIPASWNLRGTIYFSDDGSKLVKTSSTIYPFLQTEEGLLISRGAVEMFDFDINTGRFSNPLLLESDELKGNYYGSCFSPDHSKLYISRSSHEIYKGIIIQYDLSYDAAEDIISSRNIVYEHWLDGSYILSDNLGGLKRGPDDKIYFISGKPYGLEIYGGFNRYIHTIDNPNAYGSACDVQPFSVFIPPAITGSKNRGFPNKLVLIEDIHRDTVTTATEVTACYKTQEELTALDTMGRHYIWNTGQEGHTLSIHAPGTYHVTYINSDCKTQIDTFHASFTYLPLYTTVAYSCEAGEMAQLWVTNRTGDTHSYTYSWRDESGEVMRESSGTSDTLKHLSPGSYYIHITSHTGCDTILPASVLPLPAPEAAIIMDSIVCEGEPIRFSAETHADNHILWIYGRDRTSTQRDVEYEYIDKTDYRIWLVTTNPEGCSDTIYKDISVKSFEFNVSASDTIADRNTAVRLFTRGQPSYEIIGWEPAHLFYDMTAREQLLTADTSYCIYAEARSESGCIGLDSVCIKIKADVYFPTAFSPNGDGLNDYFAPIGPGEYTIQTFEIYNRYGEQVYYNHGPAAKRGWDGHYKNGRAEQGVYYYRATIVISGGRTITFTGDVSLIR